ncbi:MAG: tRNA (cytidine(56)-2'-O)-methyltransferase [Methanomassiliicoccales archaeon]|jgi:tRNA (cytidine56-2'-O)-methyltransferase|nr:tRNA (cytidine(56)-2'-O)-methyltransferase [Methanomassiliicoccales archaeon]MDD1755809.1 tRNA (cytidine(56)-2'-O)-methyltransferase [Methanomassiliicoccales archaeon]
MEVFVLRLGHRPARDKRISTHVALTARAFGAKGIFVSTKDEELEESVRDVTGRFGGDFEIRTGVKWKPLLRDFQGTKVHLTMYGVHVDDALPRIKKEAEGRVLIVVGAEKVPADVYQLADFNVAVGNQPHSEVAALAVFMDRLTDGEGLRSEFEGRLKVLPCERGKRVVDRERPE